LKKFGSPQLFLEQWQIGIVDHLPSERQVLEEIWPMQIAIKSESGRFSQTALQVVPGWT